MLKGLKSLLLFLLVPLVCLGLQKVDVRELDIYYSTNKNLISLSAPVPVTTVNTNFLFVLSTPVFIGTQSKNVSAISSPSPVSTGDFTCIITSDVDLVHCIEPIYFPEYPWIKRKLLSSSSLQKTDQSTIHLPNAITGNYISVRIVGVSGGSGQITCDFNGKNLGTNAVNGNFPSSVVFILSAPITNFNQVKITAVSGGVLGLDNYTISYQRDFVAYSNRLIFNSQSKTSITIRGFSQEMFLSRIGDGAIILGSVSNIGTNFFVSFRCETGRSYIASVPKLAVFKDASFQNLKSNTNSADHIIITPTNFTAEASILANYRTANGITSKVVSLEAIYNEFNFGVPNNFAIKSFIWHSSTRWSICPKYFVLMGDGSTRDGPIPTESVVDMDGYLRGSDQPLADWGDGYSQICLGRIPINNTNDFFNWFFKLLDYENGSYKTNVLSVADQQDAPLNFPEDSDYVTSLFPATISVTKKYLGPESLPQLRSNIVQELELGKGAFTYFGHANQTALGNSYSIFDITTIPQIDNITNPVFFLSMSCFINDFAESECLGGSMVISSNGAVATWSSCGLVAGASSRQLAASYASNSFGKANRIGDGLPASMKEMVDNGDFLVAKMYGLLGDPATSIKNKEEGRTGDLYFDDSIISYSNWSKLIFSPLLTSQISENEDLDKDGVKNLQEKLAGTDPTDPLSFLRIVFISPFAIDWTRESRKIYSIEESDDLNNWTTGTNFFLHKKFFRVKLGQ